MLPCVYKQTLGIECPGCGMQRAAMLWYQGRWGAAFWQYPALIPLVILVIACGLLWLKPNPSRAIFCQYWGIATGLLMGFYYIYNIINTYF